LTLEDQNARRIPEDSTIKGLREEGIEMSWARVCKVRACKVRICKVKVSKATVRKVRGSGRWEAEDVGSLKAYREAHAIQRSTRKRFDPSLVQFQSIPWSWGQVIP
jgi:hypothetical protein